MAVIYKRPYRGEPWSGAMAQTMGNVITGLALRKADANIRAKEAETEREFRREMADETREFQRDTEARRSKDAYIRGGYVPVQEMSKEHAEAKPGSLVESPYGELYKRREYGPPKGTMIEGTTLMAFRQPNGQIMVKDTAQRPGSSTNVNVNTDKPFGPGQKKAMEVIGKGVGESITKRNQQAFEARNQNNQLGMVKAAIADGARTGFGEETILNLRSFGQTLGIDTGDLSGPELIRKTSNEMALRLRNPESGLGLTGNTSNKDLDFLKNSVIGLGRTEAGNLKIIDAMERFNKLKMAVAEEQNRIIENNGGVPPMDIDSQLMKFVDSYPIFNNQERKALKKLSQEIVRTGTDSEGRKVIQFKDGSVEYAN